MSPQESCCLSLPVPSRRRKESKPCTESLATRATGPGKSEGVRPRGRPKPAPGEDLAPGRGKDQAPNPGGRQQETPRPEAFPLSTPQPDWERHRLRQGQPQRHRQRQGLRRPVPHAATVASAPAPAWIMVSCQLPCRPTLPGHTATAPARALGTDEIEHSQTPAPRAPPAHGCTNGIAIRGPRLAAAGTRSEAEAESGTGSRTGSVRRSLPPIPLPMPVPPPKPLPIR